MNTIAIIIAPHQQVTNSNQCIACIPERIDMLLKDKSMKVIDKYAHTGFVSDARNFIGRSIESLCPMDKQKLKRANKVFFAHGDNGMQSHLLAVDNSADEEREEVDFDRLFKAASNYMHTSQDSLYVYFGCTLG